MKNLLLIFVCITSINLAQIKSNGFDKPSVQDGIISHDSNPLFGFLNSENFSMHHSFSMSYSAFAGQGLAMGVYTNSMMYRFSDNLNLQVDASFVHSPYNTFGKEFQNNFNKIYISNAALNFRPWNDVSVTFQYRNLPYYPYDPYSRYYGSSMFNGFDNDFFFGR